MGQLKIWRLFYPIETTPWSPRMIRSRQQMCALFSRQLCGFFRAAFQRPVTGLSLRPKIVSLKGALVRVPIARGIGMVPAISGRACFLIAQSFVGFKIRFWRTLRYYRRACSRWFSPPAALPRITKLFERSRRFFASANWKSGYIRTVSG